MMDHNKKMCFETSQGNILQQDSQAFTRTLSKLKRLFRNTGFHKKQTTWQLDITQFNNAAANIKYLLHGRCYVPNIHTTIGKDAIKHQGFHKPALHSYCITGAAL